MKVNFLQSKKLNDDKKYILKTINRRKIHFKKPTILFVLLEKSKI